MNTYITKKDGSREPWDSSKIDLAVTMAAKRVGYELTPEDWNRFADEVVEYFDRLFCTFDVNTKDIHLGVIKCLREANLNAVADSYQEYRDYKTSYVREFERLKTETDRVLFLGDNENANFDSSLISTKGSLIKGYLTKSLYTKFYLTKTEQEYINRGDFYIHDLRDMIFGSFNCFAKETKFITSDGLASFEDFNDGDTVLVPSHLGNWKKATVKCFGKQKLNKVGLYRSRGEELFIYATPNHRWLLKNNEETTNLKVGDILCDTPRLHNFKWEEQTPRTKQMWCLGFLYGDGTQSKASACTVRLCGDKNKYAYRFTECGHTVTTPDCKGWCGDQMVWMADTAKVIPPLDFMTHEDKVAFINGLLNADGGKELRGSKREYRDIVVSNDKENILYNLLHTAGFYVSAQHDLTGKQTNKGMRKSGTKRYCLYEVAEERTAWRVSSIESTERYEDVWCLVVEDDHSFILEGGIPTGNCCLFDIGTVLKNGFTMSNVTYTEPNSVLSALQVIGDITLVSTAQQFGGFTLAEIDKALLPYCKKSYDHYFTELQEDNPVKTHEFYHERALKKVKRELEQGFQSLELKLNTVPCSRGDFAFTTLTFGTWDCTMNDLDKLFVRMVGETILEVRLKGHGDKQVVFPKLVYLYDKNKIAEDEDHKILFQKALECSSKCMYPDYLSLTSEYGTVSKLYKEHGVITSPMGCRAYLSLWKDPETNEYITIGRCNIGAVSLNLPLIYKRAKEEGRAFFEDLDHNLQLIREFLIKRYELLYKTKASTNPMCFTQGGLYKGFRKPEENIGDLVKYMTASFGISGLDDLTILHTGKGLKGNAKFAKKVVEHILNRVNEFKKEDGYLYALYGTPAESLCGTQMKQYHKYCRDHKCVDEFEGREYYTNSFHLNVAEDVTPFEKQNEEFELFHLIEGGHIQYVRLDNPENIEATKAIIMRGMEMGFYQGVNFDSAYCEDCGSHSTNVKDMKCPKCGSAHLSVISRVCGYLGYSNINGKSRMNDAKMAEIKDRKSM